MKSWLDKIYDVLKHPKSKQITGSLVSLEDGKLVGKCAMGELGCRIGFSVKELQRLSGNTDTYSRILNKYKVPRWLRQKNLPRLSGYERHSTSVGLCMFPSNYDGFEETLADWIYKLNDSWNLKESQIADFLEVTFGDLLK